jgi:hypothetical protein
MTKNDLKLLIKECINELGSNVDLDEVVESFDVDHSIKITDKPENEKAIHEKFSVNGNDYEFFCSFYKIQSDLTMNVWFELKNNKNKPNRKDFKSDDEYKVALNYIKTGISGTGNPFKVFSYVCNLMDRIIKQRNPKYITFEAREKKRQDLYDKIIDIGIKKFFTNYKKIKVNPLTGDQTDESDFWLERI